MSRAKYKIAFQTQRHNAARRGIGWELTFEQWLDWWGDDIERRGVGPEKLQMQRFGDSGPYALGNIKKGVPKENARTAALVLQNRKSQERKREHQAELDALIEDGRSGLLLKEALDDDEQELMRMFYPRSAMNFMRGG
ncbi:hypothetical protein [Burkholderia gladioli]|uniref:hypothetical protein n=1 Tax=Burkholderia gladioli TaxID=28095 RepID=UPI00163F52FF|nr:hypothetical protein [Burkholderia gladioli]